MSFFSFDDTGFFEMFFEHWIIEVSNKERISESVVGRKEHFVDVLASDKTLLFFFDEVSAHELFATYKR